MRIYRSFEEIDNDLAIKKLERDIAVEKIKLNIAKTKEEFKPFNLLGGFPGILKKVLITYILKKFTNL